MARKEICSLLEEPARNSKNDAGAAVQDSAQQRPRLIRMVFGDDCCDFAPKPFNAVSVHCAWHRARELSTPRAKSAARPAARRRQKISNTRAVVYVVTAAALLMTVAPKSAAGSPDDDDAKKFVAGPNVTVPFLIDHVNNAIEIRLLRNGSLLTNYLTTGQTPRLVTVCSAPPQTNYLTTGQTPRLVTVCSAPPRSATRRDRRLV
ncbi:uncharacterized protein LOC144949950 [Lampetra fluviatilis]